jgi:hypothetical protein
MGLAFCGILFSDFYFVSGWFEKIRNGGLHVLVELPAGISFARLRVVVKAGLYCVAVSEINDSVIAFHKICPPFSNWVITYVLRTWL